LSLLFLPVVLVCFLGFDYTAAAQTLADALDTTNLVWTTGGDAVWFPETTNTYDGIDAVQSGTIQSNQTSWLETTVVGPVTVSYWSFAQDPSGGSLGWRFTINNPGPPYPVTLMLPDGTWNQQVYDLGEGTNELRWTVVAAAAGSEKGFVCLDQFRVSPPRPLTLVNQPIAATVYSGAPAWLTVSAIGTPPLQYQWRKDDTNITSATNSWFSFDEATTNDTGVYSVIVSNSQGYVISSNALLTVLPPSPPFFTFEPESTTVYTGQSFDWWASVDGSPPSMAIWRKDGTNFFEETFAGPWGYNPSLTFTDVSMADAGSYTLYVTNDYGVVESSNAMLTVIASVAPVITRQPRSLEVAAGVNTWMSVGATGVPDPWDFWTREGSPPSPPGLFPPIPISGSNPQHLFNNVTTSNAGIYFAVVSNYAGGVVSQDALLTVLPAITNIGSWNQDAQDISVANGLAFLARGTNGLAILSVTNPASPELLGTFSTAGYAQNVSVAGGRAYVAEGSAGLQIINVTNPSNPTLAGSYDTPGDASDLAIRSNLVYVADGAAGLLILNVSNAASPTLVGSYVTDISADHVCLAGNDAVFSSPMTIILGTNAANVAGLVVVDISTAAHPFEAGRLSSGIGRIISQGQYVFGITPNGLQVITITNPAQPTVVGTFNSYYSTNLLRNFIVASDVRVINDLVFLAGNSGGQSQLYILDVRDPSAPIPVGYYSDSSQPTTLATDGSQVYFSGYDSPMEIIRTPFKPSEVTTPWLSVSTQAGLNLYIQGRRGLHYDVEYTDQLTGAPWQTLQTILLTNDSAAVEVPSGPAVRFFRLKQLD
jgi:LVIVD repeat/Immunoglobulin I-set domain/Immunoglobulin domain